MLQQVFLAHGLGFMKMYFVYAALTPFNCFILVESVRYGLVTKCNVYFCKYNMSCSQPSFVNYLYIMVMIVVV